MITIRLATAAGFAAVGALPALAGDCDIPAPVAYLLEGDPAPGTGAFFQTFDRPNISEVNGLIAFTADTDGDTQLDDVVYIGETLVAQEGSLAPGAKGGVYSAFEFFETGHQVNGSGNLAYICTLRDVPSTENRAVFNDVTLVAQEGSPAPGIPGRLFADFGFAGSTAPGFVGFRADLDGDTSDDSVIYLYEGGVGTILYREGDPVPGLTGETWDGNFDEIQWNCQGDMLFEGNTSLATDDMIVFRRRTMPDMSIVEDVVAQEGQAVAASGGPDFLELILQTSIAEDGSWGLRGNLGVAPSEADAIILTGSGFQAQQGDAVPELPGVVTGNFNGVDINSFGDVLYLADLEGDTEPGVDEGLFLNGCLVITDGVGLDCLPEGAVLTDIGFEDLYINDMRQIVFAASYTGGDGLFTIDLESEGDCPTDLDDDGSTGFSDLLVVLAAYGPCPDCKDPCPADIDGDGEVGFSDVLEILTAYGPCP